MSLSDQIPSTLESLRLQLQESGDPLGSAMSEAQYREQWGKALSEEREPHPLALAGGYLASELPWVFVAGYQAAIRWVFPDVSSSGWLAFAASESRDADNPLPGVRCDQSGALSGWKTWVASVNSLDALLVLVKGEGSGSTRVFEVRSMALGLSLHGPDVVAPSGKFLGAMSQGKAELVGVPATELRELSTERLRWFRYAEAISVYTALSAFLLRQSDTLGDERLRSNVIELFAEQRRAFDAADEQLLEVAGRELARGAMACAKRYEEIVGESAPGNWAVDRRVISMYAPRD